MARSVITALALAGIVALEACSGSTAATTVTETFTSTLAGGNEIPAVTFSGGGAATFSRVADSVGFSITLSNVSALAVHFLQSDISFVKTMISQVALFIFLKHLMANLRIQ